MGDQTVKQKFSYPDGVSMEISTDNGSTWLDVGVMMDGFSATYDYSVSEVEFGNAENPDPQAKNLKLSLSPSELVSWDSQVVEQLSAGLITRTVVAGTLVSGEDQVVASGDWEFGKGILLTGQNATGTAPTINSVTGSVDGLAAADDYTLVKLPGGWYLQPLDGTNFTTEAQSLTINTDYTPAAGYNLSSGTSSKVLVPYWVRFTHYTDDALTTYDYSLDAYRVYPNAGGLVFNKLGAKSDNDFDTWTVALTAERDSGRADGSQLFTIFQTT